MPDPWEIPYEPGKPLKIEVYPRGTLGAPAGPPAAGNMPWEQQYAPAPTPAPQAGPPAPGPPAAGMPWEQQYAKPDATPQETQRMEQETGEDKQTQLMRQYMDIAAGGTYGLAAAGLRQAERHQPEIAREGMETMKRGVEMFRGGDRAAGALTTLGGAFDYATSPISSPIKEIFSQPVSRATGLPEESLRTGAELVLPGVGFGKEIRTLLRPIEKIVSPGTVSPIAQEAAGLLRKSSGTAARETAMTQAAVEPWHHLVNQLSRQDQIAFLDYVEGGGALMGGGNTPQLRALANTLKGEFEKRKNKLQSMPRFAQAHFIADYFPHFWQDPNKAKQFAYNYTGGGGVSKQGSGASLKGRTIPTIADGIANGLVPLTTNPLEGALRYVRSMDQFIASTEALETGVAQGTVQYVKPRVMGASGLPGAFKVPDGYVALEGRGARRPDGSQAFAPADWARVYNNHISRGVHDFDTAGNIYDAALRSSNAITALELGLSGFHAFTMANEAFLSDLAKGVSQIAGGKPLKAVGSLVTAPLAPITRPITGHKVEQVYLGRSQGTPDMRKIVDLATEAGARMTGKEHAKDYEMSAMGNFWTSFRRGALRLEAEAAKQRVLARPSAAGKVGQGAVESAKLVGRTMETVAFPLFVKYIPKLKNGAFYDTMKEWIDANPGATHQEQVAMARKIWDSIDNRFGEMVHDNQFWNAFGRQAATLGLRSYSWNLGTIKEIGGGVVAGLRDPSRLSIASKDYDPRVAYVTAFPIGVAALSAAYQYLKTGKGPESIEDLMAPRTGGVAPGFGGKGEVPERAMLPGYQKDVFGWYNDAKQEAINKIATGPRLLGETLGAVMGHGGSDWRSDPFIRPGATVPEWFGDYLNHVGGSMVPISVKAILSGEKIGSAIEPLEAAAGIRPAPSSLQDPEGTAKGMGSIEMKKWISAQRHAIAQKQQRGEDVSEDMVLFKRKLEEIKERQQREFSGYK